MADWKTSPPPEGVELEYERDGRTTEIGVLNYAGQFGMGKNASGAASRMKTQYRRAGHTEMFEVSRWRELE